MMECPPRAQSVMTVESRTSSFFSKTFSKLRRKKGSISSVRNSTTTNPYNVGMSTPEPYFGKRFMSQPLLSLGVRDSTSSTGTTEREPRSFDVLGSQAARFTTTTATPTAQPPATPTAQTTTLTASSIVPSTAVSVAPPPAPDVTPSIPTNAAPRTAAPSVPNVASRPSRTSGKHGPSRSINAALVAGTGVGVAVVDGLPNQGDAGAFVFPPSSSKYAPIRPSTAIPAPVAPTPIASKTLPRPSTSSSSAIRPHPSFVRLPSAASPYATARLSPTLITRAPMPIINLPALPIPSMATSSANGGTIRGSGLRSMPALPRQGTMDENDNDGDSDSSDSDGEGEDDGFLDANDGGVESEEGPPAAGGNRTPRIGLRQVELPPLDLGLNGWGNLMGGGVVQTPDHAQTPTDYFSTSSRISGASIRTPGSSSIRQTQTPRIPPTPSLSSVRPQTPGTGRVATNPSSILIPQTPGTGRIPPTPASSILIPQTPVSAKQHGIYKHASRSMINILGPAMTRREEEQEQPSTSSTTAPPPVIAQPQPAPPTRRPSVLERRRSMPTFTVPGSPPPPYPAFAPHWRGGIGVALEPPDIDAVHRHHRDHPHDENDDNDDGIIEEARYPEETGHFVDMLPDYTNDIYLRAIMPRKMEFSAPGVQAKDRKWRRVVCELEGTVLRVFEDVSASSGIGAWWERKVGVGDVASSTISTAAPRSSNVGSGTAQNGNVADSRERENEPKSGEVGVGGSGQTELTLPPPFSPPHLSPPQSRSIIGRILTHGRSWSDAPSPTSPTPATQLGRTSLNIPDDGGGRRDGRSRFGSTLNVSRPFPSSASSAPSVTSSSPHSHSSSPSISSSTTSACGDSLKLLHAYTLQHAESGLGNDYLKRKNVIRVRMEGEQFLLQAGDVKSVVEWIEGLHAAANVALDLDERPMPRGPLFPRRRRRRRPATNTEGASGNGGGS